MEQASGHLQSAAAMLKSAKEVMPASMLRTVCCRADGVSKPCSLVPEAGRNLPAGSPGRIEHQQGCPALIVGNIDCGLSLCVRCRLVPHLSDLPAGPCAD